MFVAYLQRMFYLNTASQWTLFRSHISNAKWTPFVTLNESCLPLSNSEYWQPFEQNRGFQAFASARFLSTPVLLLNVWAASTMNKPIGWCLPTGLTFRNFWKLFLEFLSLHFFIRYNFNIAILMYISTCTRQIPALFESMNFSLWIWVYEFESTGEFPW